MKVLIKLWFLFFLIPATGFGQGYDSGQVYDTLGYEARAEIGQQAITDLKTGVLVVRLKTGHNKLKALERVATSPKISSKDKDQFELKIAKHKKEIQQENNLVIQSLTKHYSFSEVLYIADTAVHLLKEGMQSGYFLNETLEVDPSISLNEKTYLVVYYGNAISATKNGVEGLVVLDKNLKELPEPFPYFTGLTTTRKVLSKFWNKKGEKDFFNLMAQRFNDKLEKFLKNN